MSRFQPQTLNPKPQTLDPKLKASGKEPGALETGSWTSGLTWAVGTLWASCGLWLQSGNVSVAADLVLGVGPTGELTVLGLGFS